LTILTADARAGLMTKIRFAVVFYSTYGTTHQMAEVAAGGDAS
jgi:hypothetical protein